MKKSSTSIVFTGDIGFDRYMDRKWEDENLLSKEVLDFFHSADHTCANVEGALIDAVDDGSRGVFFHSMNPEATRVLKKMGADIVVAVDVLGWKNASEKVPGPIGVSLETFDIMDNHRTKVYREKYKKHIDFISL